MSTCSTYITLEETSIVIDMLLLCGRWFNASCREVMVTDAYIPVGCFVETEYFPFLLCKCKGRNKSIMAHALCPMCSSRYPTENFILQICLCWFFSNACWEQTFTQRLNLESSSDLQLPHLKEPFSNTHIKKRIHSCLQLLWCWQFCQAAGLVMYQWSWVWRGKSHLKTHLFRLYLG